MSKKICILSAVNIKHMSMISIYTELMKQYHIEYDIVYMDKYNEEEKFECTHMYRYVNKVKQSWPRIIKMIKYMIFLPYATHILNKNKYDFIIVWNDVAIFMFASYLSRKYKGRYCLNVRDNMGYEKKSRRRRYTKAFMNSAFNTISSKGYLDFLPKEAKYIPIHSLNLSVLQGMERRTSLRKEGLPIRIGFIGSIRYFENNKKLLDIFANDERFELHYYGTKADVLKKYAEKKNIHNTVFHDSFPVEDTKKYLKNIDIMNNLYGNETINLQKAISIKFYHALYARIPILVSDNTYVGELAQQIGVGFEVRQINSEVKEKIYAWYRQIDFSELRKGCDDFLEKSAQENKKWAKVAKEYLYDESDNE